MAAAAKRAPRYTPAPAIATRPRIWACWPTATGTWCSTLIAAAGVEPWNELPIWIPPGHEYEGMHGADVKRALAAGLRCRPVADTVRATWAWMTACGSHGPPLRAGLPAPGLDPERERALLAARTG